MAVLHIYREEPHGKANLNWQRFREFYKKDVEPLRLVVVSGRESFEFKGFS